MFQQIVELKAMKTILQLDSDLYFNFVLVYESAKL